MVLFVHTGVDKLALTPMDSPKHIIRVSISEAAKLFGISPRTIRRALTEGQVAYIVVRGRYKLNFESLVKWSQSKPTVRNKLASSGIGQFVERWKIHNRLYSPNPKMFEKKDDKKDEKKGDA